MPHLHCLFILYSSWVLKRFIYFRIFCD